MQYHIDNITIIIYPIGSMYGISTNIYPMNDPNVGKYSINGAYGYGILIFCCAICLKSFGGALRALDQLNLVHSTWECLTWGRCLNGIQRSKPRNLGDCSGIGKWTRGGFSNQPHSNHPRVCKLEIITCFKNHRFEITLLGIVIQWVLTDSY